MSVETSPDGEPATRPGRARIVAAFLAWTAAGILFMAGSIAPVGSVLWIPAAVGALVLIAAGARSPRYFFAFVAGIGITLVGLGTVNSDYTPMVAYGVFLVAGAVVSFAAFGPRTSHADPP